MRQHFVQHEGNSRAEAEQWQWQVEAEEHVRARRRATNGSSEWKQVEAVQIPAHQRPMTPPLVLMGLRRQGICQNSSTGLFSRGKEYHRIILFNFQEFNS